VGRAFIRRVLSGDSAENTIEQRFESYYARVFAYVLSNVGNPGRARDLVTDVFASILRADREMADEKFRRLLFSSVRELCRKQARAVHLDVGLARPERELISLAFDAQLSVPEAAQLCGEKHPSARLLRAIRGLRGDVEAPEIPLIYRQLEPEG
jgi:DNA-directed RNA polymerase specialized sigma24 family protein